jgi:Zn-dependent protease with chaperone function
MPPAPADLTRATARYKRHAWLAVVGLFGFVALYLSLTGWFCWTSARLFWALYRGDENGFFDFLGGALSGLLGVFLLGALFFIKSGGKPSDLEVTASEEPELFAFLNALADRARAPRPHRVFLSMRVNAAVFYDLSLVNLLFPTKKNLEIGLGLVNTLSLSEMTAVLAHEFGHFAQRSMAVGRWVYIAQQVAGQIVASRSWLDRALAALSSIDIRVAWIGWMMRIIVSSIRSLLDTAFGLVILAQRALGREMEFQADLVSVSLAGSDALVHALYRLGAADGAWSNALSIAGREASLGHAVPDLFLLQTRIIERMAGILNEPTHGASPAARAGERRGGVGGGRQARRFLSKFSTPIATIRSIPIWLPRPGASSCDAATTSAPAWPSRRPVAWRRSVTPPTSRWHGYCASVGRRRTRDSKSSPRVRRRSASCWRSSAGSAATAQSERSRS